MQLMRRIVSPRHSCLYYCSAAEATLREHARAAGFHGLHLGLAPGQTTEASGELGAVEEFARLGPDGAQGGAGLAADATAELGATEWAVLLGLRPVGGEGIRKTGRGRGRVNTRGVVNGLCGTTLVGFIMHRSFTEDHVRGTERLPKKRIRGVRPALRRAKVARIVMVVGGKSSRGLGILKVCEIQGPVVSEPTEERRWREVGRDWNWQVGDC